MTLPQRHGVVASDFSGISHRQRKVEQPDGRTGFADELMLRSVGQLLDHGDAQVAAAFAASDDLRFFWRHPTDISQAIVNRKFEETKTRPFRCFPGVPKETRPHG